MSRRNEMILLTVLTVVIAFLLVKAVLADGLWQIHTLAYIAALACMIVGWIKFLKNDGE